jgi:hypothetical protein
MALPLRRLSRKWQSRWREINVDLQLSTIQQKAARKAALVFGTLCAYPLVKEREKWETFYALYRRTVRVPFWTSNLGGFFYAE